MSSSSSKMVKPKSSFPRRSRRGGVEVRKGAWRWGPTCDPWVDSLANRFSAREDKGCVVFIQELGATCGNPCKV